MLGLGVPWNYHDALAGDWTRILGTKPPHSRPPQLAEVAQQN